MVQEISTRFRRLRALALGLFVSSSHLALSSSGALAQAQVGTNAAVQGDVFVRGGGGTEAQRRAAVRDEIALGDEVLTKQQSALQILLLDASTFTVGENAEITIDRFVYDPDSGAGELSARVAKGAFRFMSGRIGGTDPTKVTISTRAAVIGTRGTFFESVSGEDAYRLAQKLGVCDPRTADPATASLIVLRGPGRNRNTLDRTGRISVRNNAGEVTISEANYAAFVPSPNHAPCGPFFMPPELRDYLDFFLRSRPQGDPVNPLDIRETGGTLSGQSDIPPPPPPDFGLENPSIIEGLEMPPPPPPPSYYD